MLHELQRRMAAALLSGDLDAMAGAIGGGPIAGAARLQIHRNNLFTSLTEALAAQFPVVERLVGDGFFAYATHRFIASHPPSAPCLAAYGAALPRFLESFAPAQGSPYLADVARLEWALVSARNTARGLAVGLERLATVPRAEIAAVRLVLDPALGLLTSSWPIDAIWIANQPERDGAVAIDETAGMRFVEVARQPDDTVAITAQVEAVWRFRRALQIGQPLGEAAGRACAADPAFDLARALHRLFTDGLVTALSPSLNCRTEGDPS